MSDTLPTLPPPQGDEKAAGKYVSQLSSLINQDKIKVSHTDLKTFEPCSIQDHYRIDLDEYDVELSHTKDPNTNKDYFLMLFNNIKKTDPQTFSKVILAYIHLNSAQFRTLKEAGESQIERIKKQAEAKRFSQALSGLDSKLNNTATSVTEKIETTEPPVPEVTASNTPAPIVSDTPILRNADTLTSPSLIQSLVN